MARPLSMLLALVLLAACDGGAPKVNIGMAAPEFASVGLDGSAVRFPEDFRGHPLVIRFWADWCRYCAGEMQAIDRVYRRLQARGLRVVAVNVGQDRDTVVAFVRGIGIAYPALLDESSAITRRYGVTGLPTTYFVGADGQIKAKAVGETDEATFGRLAEALL